MALRLRLYDLRLSRLPQVLGLCSGDLPQLAAYINSAQERLLTAPEAGDEGWWGTFAEMAFKLSRSQPYLTAPREVARVQAVNVCNRVWPLQNQFYEYLEFGTGRMPKQRPYCDWLQRSVLTRNTVPVFSDPPEDTPYSIRVYASDAADMSGISRVLVQGTDENSNTVYSQDGTSQVKGEFITLASPFASSTNNFLGLPTGIQKDVTQGPVQFFWVDPATGTQTLMLTMEPGEQTAAYRRYYFSGLPRTCCPPSLPGSTSDDLTVTAIVKLELIPVRTDTDYTLIQSQEAIINECEAVRYEGMDNGTAAGLADRKHKKAIQLLNGELAHRVGTLPPAINFAPFGSAHFARETANFI